MKIQLLFFPGCPNVAAARQALRRALERRGLPPDFEEVDVTALDTPESLRSWGSPTILVDGADVAGEPGPSGSSCRLYPDAGPHVRGVPSESRIEATLQHSVPPRWSWVRVLGPVPAAVLALLPSASCPVCIAAYVGVLSALGVGFLLREQVLVPLILLSLAFSVGSVAWASRGHRGAGPLVATLVGAAAIITGRLLWSVPSILYSGMVLLIGASLWSLWLSRPRTRPLIQIRHERREERA